MSSHNNKIAAYPTADEIIEIENGASDTEECQENCEQVPNIEDQDCDDDVLDKLRKELRQLQEETFNELVHELQEKKREIHNIIIQRETGKNPGDSSRDRHLVQIHCCQMAKLKLDADNDFEFVQNIIEELNEPDHLNMECFSVPYLESNKHVFKIELDNKSDPKEQVIKAIQKSLASIQVNSTTSTTTTNAQNAMFKTICSSSVLKPVSSPYLDNKYHVLSIERDNSKSDTKVQGVKAIQNSLASVDVTATTSATTTNTQNAMHKTIDSLSVLEPDFRFTEELTGTFCPPKCYNYDPKERYKIPDTITKDGLKIMLKINCCCGKTCSG